MSSSTGPKEVMIIRHGEKLGDPKTDKGGGRDLSIQGSARAAALPSLFIPANPPLSCPLQQTASTFSGSYQQIKLSGKAPRFPTPDFIFATAPSSDSNRPIETITPLSCALGLMINPNYTNKKKHVSEMANAILTDPLYTGKIVLICWHHGMIATLASDLGVAKPPAWPGTVFDRVWRIKFSGKTATLKDHAQRLLYGDSAS